MRRIAGFIIGLIAIVGLFFLVWINRYNIYDEYRLYNYIPPAAIAQLANQTTMTPYARKLFYVYHPIIEGSASFNKDCNVTEAAIVLGCTAIDRGIWLYDVSDPQLNGVEQVTAAHEMLHVAYSRLSSSELKYINNQILITYNNLAPNDPLLKSEYQSYLKTEGQGAVLNELHSVLGTEIANLPLALENYYNRYFSNRQVIVNYANSYEGVFTARQLEVQQDDQQLSTWQQQISQNEEILQNDTQELQAQLAQLNQLKSSGQTTSYNNQVDSYNQSVNTYNSLVNTTKQLITNYNQLVAKRNSIAVSEDKLIQSISSLPSSITAQ